MMNLIPTFDLIALVWFLALMWGYQIATSVGPLQRRNISAAIQRRRIEWMHVMAKRELRMVDAQILANLSQGNAFFASTSLIIVGGLASVMGSGNSVHKLLERLPFVDPSSPELWQIKIILLMVIFIFAFFKFAWAFRLSHYTAIMIGATPEYSARNATECLEHANAAGELVGIAASHANTGLRSFYHAIAAISWFLHPAIFMIAAAWVVAIMVRRDYFSASRGLISFEERSD